MLAKGWFYKIFFAALAAIFTLLAIWTMPVRAECGDNPQTSSCVTCHEKELPVYENGDWHTIHGRKECCSKCHGGNCTAADKEQAHEGLVSNPLSDIYLSCHQCHPDDYTELAAQFATTLQITPSSSATSTPVPGGSFSSGPTSGGLVFPSNSAGASPPPVALLAKLLVVFTGAGILAFFVLALGWLDKHHVPG